MGELSRKGTGSRIPGMGIIIELDRPAGAVRDLFFMTDNHFSDPVIKYTHAPE